MTAVIYLRVSTEEQAERGYSLAAQEAMCKARAKSLRAAVEVYRDEGVSGSTLERPALNMARERLRRGDVRYFVCLDPDRLSRKLAHQLILTEEIEQAGCMLEFVNFDWKQTAEGRLYYSLRGAIAEYEKEKIVERTKAGKIAKALQGKLTHAPGTYGYRFDTVSDELIPLPHESAVVRYMFSMAIEGLSYKQIADRLNSCGIPSPRGALWSRGTVRRIVRNPTYKGTLLLRQSCEAPNHIPVAVPQIVDARVWSTAQQVASKRRHRGQSHHFYLLSTLVRCGVCGSSMHGNLVTSRTKKYAYYVCSAKSPGKPGLPRCRSRHIDAVWLDNVAWETTQKALVRTLSATDEPHVQPKSATSSHEFLTSMLTLIDAEIARLTHVYQAGHIDMVTLEKRLSQVRARQQRLAKNLEQTPEPAACMRRCPEEVMRRLPMLSAEHKKSLVSSLIERISIWPERIVLELLVPV